MTEYNTQNLTEIVTDINNNISDVISLLDTYYTLFTNMPSNSGEWVGKNAEEYVRIINVHKKQYSGLIDNLIALTKVMSDFCFEVESSIQRMQSKVER